MFLAESPRARIGLELGRELLGFEINKKSFDHFYPRRNDKIKCQK
jgi:hypothetical protein